MEEDRHCIVIKKDGTRCQMYALRDSQYCFTHDKRPEVAEQKALAIKAGGQVGHIRAQLSHVNVDKVKDIKTLMAKTVSELRRGVADPRVAVAIKACADTFLKASEVDFEERLEALEKEATKQRKQRERDEREET